MTPSRDQWARGVMNGDDRSLRATIVRTVTSVAEPAYATVMRLRNALYDSGALKATSLGRPVISVGNATTGGTGKTPVVQWLATQVRAAGHKPAILLRGYKRGDSAGSDEAQVLASALGDTAVIQTGSSRIDSAARVLAGHPEVDVFLLDDAFQHRKARRDFDLVLVNAADPFGFGRVLPRGLLREPLSGLRRASAIVITRADQVTGEALAGIERTIRRHNTAAPIYRASHLHTGLRSGQGIRAFGGDRFFAFAGIGNPDSLADQLRRHSPTAFAGHCWFPDHHDYSARDLTGVGQAAIRAGASFLVTTEKDWVKVAPLAGSLALPVYRLELEVRFAGDDGERLLKQVLDAVAKRS